MANPCRLLFALLLCSSLFVACKKDGPHPSAANNDIVETVPAGQRPVSTFINQYISGYYESIPQHYQVTTKNYPLIIFLHGAGQEGDGGQDLPLVLHDGIAKQIQDKTFPPNFNVDGNNFSFLVLSPQLRAMPTDTMIISFLNFAKQYYRIDPARIYLVGISMGGVVTTQVAGRYTSNFAAAVSVSGATYGSDKATYATGVAKGGLALWSFHNTGDPVLSSSSTIDFISLVNGSGPVIPARQTLFNAAVHDAWTKALDPAYKENNMNVYEWLLHFKR